MIEYKIGDMLTEDVEAIVNTVNCVGVMGRGIALQFKKAYPNNFKAYANACKSEKVRPGEMFVFPTGLLTNPKFIVNFPTKRHWREKSRIEDIESGLSSLVGQIKDLGIKSIAVPPLGSGLGGLDWNVVRALIEEAFENLEGVRVVVFEPGGGAADSRGKYSSEEPSMTAGRAALVQLMHSYLKGLMDPHVSLLEVHKLMYFLQVAGQPLRLKIKKGRYGPYAENLRHVMTKIEGHFVSGYEDGGDVPSKEIKLLPRAVKDSADFLSKSPQTKIYLEKVCDLVDGFETPFGLELLATTHWIVSNLPVKTYSNLITEFYDWNERKRQFSERQIGVAIDVLAKKGWVSNAWSRLEK